MRALGAPDPAFQRTGAWVVRQRPRPSRRVTARQNVGPLRQAVAVVTSPARSLRDPIAPGCDAPSTPLLETPPDSVGQVCPRAPGSPQLLLTGAGTAVKTQNWGHDRESFV